MNTYEIYIYNNTPVYYAGVSQDAGTIPGWDIKLIMTDKDITTYPYFDCIITKNDININDCELF